MFARDVAKQARILRFEATEQEKLDQLRQSRNFYRDPSFDRVEIIADMINETYANIRFEVFVPRGKNN